MTSRRKVNAANAKPTTFPINLTPDEGTMLKQALDVVLRSTGILNAKAVVILVDKLDAAHDAVFPPLSSEQTHA